MILTVCKSITQITITTIQLLSYKLSVHRVYNSGGCGLYISSSKKAILCEDNYWYYMIFWQQIFQFFKLNIYWSIVYRLSKTWQADVKCLQSSETMKSRDLASKRWLFFLKFTSQTHQHTHTQTHIYINIYIDTNLGCTAHALYPLTGSHQ